MKYEYDNYIPTNAAYLSIALCNLAYGGEVRFRNFSLTVVRDRMNKPGNVPGADDNWAWDRIPAVSGST